MKRERLVGKPCWARTHARDHGSPGLARNLARDHSSSSQDWFVSSSEGIPLTGPLNVSCKILLSKSPKLTACLRSLLPPDNFDLLNKHSVLRDSPQNA